MEPETKSLDRDLACFRYYSIETVNVRREAELINQCHDEPTLATTLEASIIDCSAQPAGTAQVYPLNNRRIILLV